MVIKTEVNSFITLTQQMPVIDTRSPAEYSHAAFPGAFNIPLLNNEERAIVGITYKQKGNQEAVIKGYDLVGHKFSHYIHTALEIAPEKKIALYCWRGGLRSNIMSFVLGTAGFKVYLLTGGYKSFRNWVLKTLDTPQKINIIGGKTGSGKTKVLQCLKQLGAQIIDLEALAHHKGSAFGALGQATQPSVEMFENTLALQWNNLNPEEAVWLENESRLIGKVRVPQKIYETMRLSNDYDLQVNLEQRVKHIIDEYGSFEKPLLADCTKILEKKLGNLRMKQALEFLEKDDLEGWIKILLQYYDKTYLYGKETRQSNKVITVEANGKSDMEIAQELIKLSDGRN